MKKLFAFLFFVALTVTGASAQIYTSVDWTAGGSSYTFPGAYSVTTTPTTFSLVSNELSVYLELLPDGHTMQYSYSWNFTQWGTPGQNGEFQGGIAEDNGSGHWFCSESIMYNNYLGWPGWTFKPYVVSDGFCGTFDVNSGTPYPNLDVQAGMLSSDGGSNGEYAAFWIFPQLIP